MFQQVSVWLDGSPSDRGAFGHALEWASRLRLPLHALAKLTSRSGEDRTGALKEYAQACARKEISWDVVVSQEAQALCAQEFFAPLRLCVFGQSLPTTLREELLWWSLHTAQVATLVCPTTWAPLSRVLLLNQWRAPAGSFLTNAARVCRAFRLTPVVLTVARTEAEARLRQRDAEDVFAAHDLSGDFDFLVGCEVRAAVSLEARCRRCSHVFLERQNAKSWWRWLRGDAFQELLGISDSLAFLALPGSGFLAPGGEPSRNPDEVEIDPAGAMQSVAGELR
jgi:hypothetical protein